MPEDAVKLDDASAIHHCLRDDLRLRVLAPVFALLTFFRSDLTNAATRQFSRRQLRLACAANDMDGFVEVERGGSHE
jgi:hypothetical protein